MSIPTTAPASMVDVIQEDADVKEVVGSLVEVSSAAMEAYEVLTWAMKSVYLGHDLPFQGLLEALERSGEEILEGVQVVISNSLYNSRPISAL